MYKKNEIIYNICKYRNICLASIYNVHSFSISAHAMKQSLKCATNKTMNRKLHANMIFRGETKNED